jgi:MipA family protein
MKRISASALFLILLAGAGACHAESQPLWEVGAGIGVLDAPDYRGSAVRHTYALPTPYLVYRGRYLRADRSGVRAALFESAGVEVNLSLNGTLARSSGDNPLRQDMAPLRPTIEIGPTVDLKLWQTADRRRSLDLRLPVRASVTLSSPPRNAGWLFSPNLNLALRDPAGWPRWKLGMQGGPVFGNRRYNGYYYTVAPSEATAGRPAYAAPGGYAGAQFTATLSKRFSKYWLGAFLRYDNLAGAAFADSPLLQRRDAVTAGLAFAWVFASAAEQVVDSE